MNEYEQEDPIPQGDLALQLTALPRETNGFGDIYGGWLVSQMDLAGTAMASRVAGGRVAGQGRHRGRRGSGQYPLALVGAVRR